MNANPPNEKENAVCELEQQLIGWQLKGAPGALEFAAKEFRIYAPSFLPPHSRTQAAIFEAIDAGRAISPAIIAAELADCAGIGDLDLPDYLRGVAGAAPATISPHDTRSHMRNALRTWRRLQGAMPKAGSVELVRGDAVDPEPIEWIWPSWLAAGKLHILGGQAGSGKTTIAVALAATLSNGGLFPDGSRAPVGDTLIWSGEDDFRDSILPRFMANGGMRERIHHVKGRHDGKGILQPFDPALDVGDLVAAAKGPPNLKLMIIDPVVSAVPGDSHKNAEVRRGMQPLVRLAEQAKSAVLGITHFTKGTAGRDPIERITGSLAFVAQPRVVWCTAKSREPGKPSRLVRIKSNVGPDGGGFDYELQQVPVDEGRGIFGQMILWGEVLDGDAKALIAEIEAPEQPGTASALDAAKTWLTEILGTGTVRVPYIKDTATQMGHAWATVKRAKNALGVVAIRQGADGWAWQMPKALKKGEDAHLKS